MNAPASFATLHMGPPVARFCVSNPAVTVHLVLADQLVDLVEERVDLAIRITKLEDSSLAVRKIAATSLHVCASPAYLRARGTPKRPEDLLHHNCLRYSLLRDEDEWRLYGEGGRVRVPVRGAFETNQGLMLLEAAIAGMGLAVLPRFAPGGGWEYVAFLIGALGVQAILGDGARALSSLRSPRLAPARCDAATVGS